MAKIDEHKEYIGTVIDNEDPNHAGRCKIKVAKIMDGMDENLIPWATPGSTNYFSGGGGGNLSVPKKGAVMKVRFKEGELKAPEYYGIQKIDPNLVNEITNDYIDTQVITYDHDNDMSIMYQVNSGIRVYLKGSYVQINPDGMITLNHAGDTAIIQLDGNKINIVSTNEITVNSKNTVNVQSKNINLQATESTTIKGSEINNNPENAVNGIELFNYLQFLANKVDMKYPASPGVCEQKLISLKHKLLNSKIKYV